jgi:uncharacterized protein (UPF0332 family)
VNQEEHIRLLMAKADESLAVADGLLAQQHHEFAASRAYYAMFYAAQAALLLRNMQFAKHSAVIARFNREFVKSGVFAPSLFKALEKGFTLRNQGDYGILPLEPDEAASLLVQARDFLVTVRAFLEREGL